MGRELRWRRETRQRAVRQVDAGSFVLLRRRIELAARPDEIAFRKQGALGTPIQLGRRAFVFQHASAKPATHRRRDSVQATTSAYNKDIAQVAARPSRLDTLRNLQASYFDLAFISAFISLTSGIFLIGFIRDVGGGDAWINFFAALPSAAGLLQIPGALWGRSFPSYKPFVRAGGLLWRGLHVPLIALPLLAGLSGDIRLVILAMCIGIGTACIQTVQPIYNDWLAEMVPSNSRGWFFGRRTVISTGASVTIGLLGGLFLDRMRSLEADMTGYAVLFAVGIVFAFLSFGSFLRMRDLPRANPIRVRANEALRAITSPVRDARFRRVLGFSVMFMLGQMFAGSLFVAFALESLNLTFTQIQITQIAVGIGVVLCAGMWGYFADRYGNKPVLAIIGVLLAITPAMWLFCEPGQTTRTMFILTPGHLFSGAVWSGVAVCQLNLYIATAPPAERPNYLGMALAVQSLAGAVAPMLGAATMTILRGSLPPELAYKWVFGIAMGLRLVSILFLLPVREEGSISIRGTLRQLFQLRPGGVQALRDLSRSGDVRGREGAIARVGSAQMGLGANELVKALADPSPRVRRRAASALAQLEDPNGARALIRHIEDHPEMVEEETLEALAKFRHPESVPVLLRFLQDPRSTLRRTSARSLGMLQDPRVVEPLMQVAGPDEDPDMRRSALQALRQLGDPKAEPIVRQALEDPNPSIRGIAAEVVGELGLRDCAPLIRRQILESPNQSPELAYALGAVGTLDDLPLMLSVASAAESDMARRRCLLGMARLLGVESSVYRLLMSEGIGRDELLMQMIRPAYRKSKRIRDAVEAYGSSQEDQALAILSRGGRRPWLAHLAALPVQESFLLAVTAFVKHVEPEA